MSEADRQQLVQALADEVEARRKANGGGFLAEKLKLNIGTAITVGCFIAAATWTVQGRLGEVQRSLDSLTGDRWKAAHQRIWSYELGRYNPALKVPDVDEIKQRLDKTP